MSICKGVIIEESLENKAVLSDVKITETIIEPITPEHKTPHLKQWTLHTVEVPSDQIESIAKKLSQALDSKHNNWYADLKDEITHYIIFRNKVFKISRSKPEQYQAVTKYGVAIGIPDYQLDFSPDIETWERNNKL